MEPQTRRPPGGSLQRKLPKKKELREMSGENKTSRMTDDEKIAILEEIARDPKAYPSARITAIRTLREFWPEEPKPRGAFADLDELRPRRQVRTAHH